MNYKMHNNIIIYLSNFLKDYLSKSSLEEIYNSISLTPSIEKGHFCFKPFIVAKQYKAKPQELIEDICQKLTTNENIIAISVSKNYLNFKLSTKFLASNTLNSKKESLCQNPKNIMIEYSQPNTHKQLHIGHMRNLCLGNTLINIQKRVGHNVTSATYPGDIGTHVAKALYYIKHVYKEALPTTNKGEWLGNMYVLATEYAQNNNIEDNITTILKAIKNKDEPYYSLWKETRQWSIDLMKETYKWSGVEFDEWFFESTVDKSSVEYITSLYQDNLLVKNDGAIGLDLSEDNLGFCVLLKKDGNGLYSTKDIELARKKFQEYNIDESIYLVDNRQSLHFKQIFKALEKIGFEQSKNCKHVAYEMVELPEGAMESRKGNIIPIAILINNMEEHIESTYLNDKDWSEQEKSIIKKQIANAAIKYGMVCLDNTKKITFKMKEWLKLEGETGPYLQYSAVRINSILNKVKSNATVDYSLLSSKQEVILLMELNKFNDVLIQCSKNYKSVALCKYLYSLAKSFNSFYAECSINNAANEQLKASRLELAKKTLDILSDGLSLLGIEVPNKM